MIKDKTILDKRETSVLVCDNASQVLFAKIRDDIYSGKLLPGDKLQPLRELSDFYGLSFEAVRKVINRLASLNLVIRKRGSGIYVAVQEEHSNHSCTITNTAILMMDSYGHVYSDIAENIVKHLQDDKIDCVRYARNHVGVGGIPESVYDAVVKWRENPPRAVVVGWLDTRLFNELKELSSLGTRIIVLFGSCQVTSNWDYVGSNIEMQAELAGEWLLKRGHKRIGLVTHRRYITPGDPSSTRKRTVGSTALITELGHVLREKSGRKGMLTLLYNYSNGGMGSDPLSKENIDRAIKWLSQKNRPTAVFGTDFRLVGIIKAAEELGLRIPEDIELLGVGRTPWSEAYKFKSLSLNESLIADHIARLITDENTNNHESVNRIFVSPSLDDDNNNNVV